MVNFGELRTGLSNHGWPFDKPVESIADRFWANRQFRIISTLGIRRIAPAAHPPYRIGCESER
jgi:hypothetical protein